MSLLAGLEWVSVDLETTGWSADDRNAIIEIGCVEGLGDQLGSEWSTLVQPGFSVPPDSTAIHGITDAMLVGAPLVSAIAADVRRRCGDRLLVFHNSAFDLPFLRRMMAGAGLAPLVNPVLDTLGLARGLFGSGNNTLVEVRERLGLPLEDGAHRALPDARATARALVVLSRTWEQERGVASLFELAAASLDAIRARMSPPAPVP